MTTTPFKWTDELRATAVEEYKNRIGEIAEDERPNHTQEIATEIAVEMGCTLNSLRTILQRAKNEGSKRRGKAESHADLIAAIQAMAGEDAVDMEVIDKLTGKAADYVTNVLLTVQAELAQ
jgi:transposase-like protein